MCRNTPCGARQQTIQQETIIASCHHNKKSLPICGTSDTDLRSDVQSCMDNGELNNSNALRVLRSSFEGYFPGRMEELGAVCNQAYAVTST